MNGWSKAVAALLTVVVVMQFMVLRRQENLEQQFRNLLSQQNQAENRLAGNLNSMNSRLSQMEEAERWVSVQRESVAPGSDCETSQARVEWTLQQWTAGTESRLLYRTGREQPWQEATVSKLGGQSYFATFPLAIKPRIMPGVSVEYVGRNMAQATATAEAKSAFDRDVQYQITAEGPGVQRSTGAKGIPLGGQFILPVNVRARVANDGRYTVDLHSDPVRQDPCTRLEGAEVRAFAGDRQVNSAPLTVKQAGLLTSEWQTKESITRLDLIVRYGGTEEIIPIPIQAR